MYTRAYLKGLYDCLYLVAESEGFDIWDYEDDDRLIDDILKKQEDKVRSLPNGLMEQAQAKADELQVTVKILHHETKGYWVAAPSEIPRVPWPAFANIDENHPLYGWGGVVEIFPSGEATEEEFIRKLRERIPELGSYKEAITFGDLSLEDWLAKWENETFHSPKA